MHPIRSYITNFVSLSLSTWQVIEPCFTRVEYPADAYILAEPQICRKLYFLEEGFLRYFVTKANGEESTKYFTEAPYCFTAQRSLTQQIPSEENIITLEPSVIWEMDREDAFGLLRLPEWSEFVRKLIQEVQFNTEDILQDLQNRTAEERYRDMLATNDTILQKAPLKDIASFLGIAPQSLSRIRRKCLLEYRS